jgi:predicted ATPase/class 3 adenylate cyclase
LASKLRSVSATPHEQPSASTRSGSIPSGTVTFVFTDIEGSTERWERDRAAMQSAVRRHDELVRSAIVEHDGHVFKTIGDAFCAAFWRPEDAVTAMLDVQRRLADEDFSAVDGLRVRGAIHTGTADERGGDYFGPAVNRVARLLAIGHGGQVLVSGVSADLLQGTLPSQATLRDLGEHQLKDLARPEYVYQLLAPGLQSEFPPLRSLDALPNNLPRQLTSFIGRDAEVTEITALIEAHPLVTLVGSGGIGKTRTSLQVAANLLDGSGDGVWFIELAPLSSGDFIPATVARIFSLTLQSEGDAVENLASALKTTRALLVFDNCEHLVDSAARVVAALVKGCPKLKILASSRQGLGITGEQTYRLPALDVSADDQGRPLTASDGAQIAAIALFTERARAIDKRFILTDDNAPIVADICRRLDGIPLAIELAAARVKILSPRQLRDRLDERFRVLTGGSRDVLPRQQTLRALIDWSYDLLDDRERVLFRRLGIFVDGFTMEGASAVASDAALDELDVFDLVASLVEKSLVLAEPSGDALRYRLLESTRAYASEKLRDAGERDLLAGRYLRYLRDVFAELHARQEATMRSSETSAVFATELEGVRFALADALARSDYVIGAELLASVERSWIIGLGSEGIAQNEAFINALPGNQVLLLAKLSGTLAGLLCDDGMFRRSREVASKARDYARASGDGNTLAFTLRWYAAASLQLHEFIATDAALDEAAAIPITSARLRSALAEVRIFLSRKRGDLEAAASGFEQAIAEQLALGNLRNAQANVLNLSDVEFERGRTSHAIALVRDLLPALRSGADRRLCAMAFEALGDFLFATGDLRGAVEASCEAIATLAREPEHSIVTNAVELVALVDGLEGRFARASRLVAYADWAFARARSERQPNYRVRYERLTALLDANVAPEDRARFTSEGAALAPEAAIALALQAP